MAEGASIPARGEFVLVVGMGEPRSAAARAAAAGSAGQAADPVAAARAEVERLVGEGSARGEAAKRVAASSGIPRRALYGAPTDRGAAD
jgi:hypothetical protein